MTQNIFLQNLHKNYSLFEDTPLLKNQDFIVYITLLNPPIQIAKPYTDTIQNMVLFSQRTVQLPSVLLSQ